ncbi:Ig-like domain repeat protein [Cryobacterium algoricola]|uniref:Ig-like domain repeat protein n=1 Tax=Cryobacterium algoricola TaxID=1259183 RepID=A0ABY2ICI8_9MICO|nr:Ig-like domain-containing protein [Cryobacterium algoricola]TFB85309.1 Ig-like domain repeat protein [Cryobacterium algoricola]
MSTLLFPGARDRLRASSTPAVLARSLLTAVLVIAAMPVVAIVALFALSLAAPALAATGPGAIVLGAGSTVLLYGTAGLALLFGVVLSGFVHAGAHAKNARLLRVSWNRTLRAFPRLVLALALLVVAFVAATALWPFISLALLIVAGARSVRPAGRNLAAGSAGPRALWSRVTPGSRRALLWAIPLIPALAALALLVAVLPASLATPGSLRELVTLAWARVRTGYRDLGAFALVAGVLASAASLGGISAAIALDPADDADITGPLLSSLAVLVVAVVLVQVCVGAAAAIFTPDATTRAPRLPPRASIRSIGALMSRGTRPATGRVAMVVIVALITVIAPLPAFAQSVTGSALLTPALALTVTGVDASTVITAEVRVSAEDGAGLVQFLDGTTTLGAPVELVTDPVDPSRFTAVLPPQPVFSAGSHDLSFVYAPVSALVATGQSPVTVYVVGQTPAAVTLPSAPPTPTPSPSPAPTPSATPSPTPSPAPTGTAPQLRAATVATEATDTVAQVYNTTVIGESLDLGVQVSAPAAPAGTVVPGRVNVYQGSTLLGEIDQSPVGGYVSLVSDKLVPGPATLRVEYIPEAGFAASEYFIDVTILKARTSFSGHVIVPDNYEMTWGDTHTVTVTVRSAVDEPRVLNAIVSSGGQNQIVATVPFTIVNGEATVVADFTRLLPGGTSYYTLQSPATALADAGSIGDYFAKQVDPAATETSLAVLDASGSPTQGNVHEPVTLTARVASPSSSSTPASGTVRFTSPGLYLGAPVAVNTEGVASVTFTPDTRQPYEVTAEYGGTGATGAYLPSTSTPVTVTPDGALTGVPDARWTGALTLVDTRLTVRYPTSGSLAAPTGTVTILDAAGMPVALDLGSGTLQSTFTLSAGEVTLPVRAPVGTSNYRVVYSGDPDYMPRTDALPAVTVTPPIVTLTAGTPGYYSEPTSFTVRVKDVPSGFVQGVTVYATAAGGLRTVVGTISVDASTGAGGMLAPLTGVGATTLTAEATFTPESGVAPVSSAPQTIIAPAPFAPVVTLTIDASTVYSATNRGISVTVQALSAGRVVTVPSGTVAIIRDNEGAQIGRVVLTGATDPSGWAYLNLDRSGLTGITASVPYGPFGAIETGPLVALPVPERNNYTSLSATSVVSGGVVAFDLLATVSGTPLDSTRSVTVLAEFNGEKKTVVLTRTGVVIDHGWLGTDVTFAGSVDFPAPGTGYFNIHVTGPGNGADVGAIDFTGAGVSVGRHTTTLLPSGTSTAVGGHPLSVTAAVTAVEPGGAAPTGTVTYTLAPAWVSCEAPVGDSCVFPGPAVRSGTNTLRASYAGDHENSPASATIDVQAQARTATLAVDFSVAPDQWIVGEPVTATWTVTTSARPAAGRVTVLVSGAEMCDGIALGDRCTFTVPPAGAGWTAESAYRVDFHSYDDAPDQSVTGRAAAPKRCYVVDAWAAVIDVTGATACTSQGRPGVLSGSTVRLTARPLAANYVLAGWQLNGVDVVSGTADGLTTSIVVSGSGTYSYRTVYAPKCFTLTLAPNSQIAAGTVTKDDVKGEILVATKPNCSDPDAPTTADRAALSAGKPRYAVGTVVNLRTETIDHALYGRYVVAAFDGLTRQPANPETDWGSVTMDSDRTVSATFAVRSCHAFVLDQSAGGTATIVSTSRPASSGALKPATGACRTSDGTPGYVPGTAVVIETVADTGYSFTKLDHGDDKPKPQDLVAVALTTEPAPTAVTRTTVLAGTDGYGYAHPVFSHKDCVSVTLRVTETTADYRAYGFRSGLTVHVYGVDPEAPVTECAAPVTAAPEDHFGLYKILSTTYSVVSSATVVVNGPRDRVPRRITWSTSYGDTTIASRPVGGPTPASDPVIYSSGGDYDAANGPGVDLSKLPAGERSVVINTSDMDPTCAAPTIQNPFGAPYQVRLTNNEWGAVKVCREANQAASFQTVVVTAAVSQIPTLRPVFSYATSVNASPDGRRYFDDRVTLSGSDTAALEYCARLNLTVRMHEDDGTVRVLGEGEAAQLIQDNGGCAPMNTRPGGTVTTGLTVDAQYHYTILNTPAVMPVLEVDGNGVSAPAVLDLKVNCVSVDVGDRTSRDGSTPPNCPGGGGNRYLKGSIVQLNGEVHDDEGLNGWDGGVDEQNGVTAWIVAETDRYGAVSIDYPSKWEKFKNGLSNFTQRLVSGLIIVATGVILVKMMLAKMVTLALKGIGSLVALAGGGDGMLNVMTKLDNAVTAVIKTVGLFSSCINTSAKGTGSLTDIPTGTLGAKGATATDTGLKVGSFAAAQAGKYLNSDGTTVAGSALMVIGSARTMVDLFGSNTSLYGKNATAAWTSMGTGLGGCMTEGLDDNAHLLLSDPK